MAIHIRYSQRSPVQLVHNEVWMGPEEKKISLCLRTGCLHPLQTQWFVVILMVSTLHTLTSVYQLSSPYCSLYISQSADKENLRRASLAGDHFLFLCDHNV